MDYQITMGSLRLIESLVSVPDTSKLEKDFFIWADSSGTNSEPVYDGDKAYLGSKIHLVVKATDKQVPPKDDATILEINFTFEGEFTLPAEQAQKMDSDISAKKDILQRMANRMFPLIKNHTEETARLMGIGTLDLPWHLDVDTQQ